MSAVELAIEKVKALPEAKIKVLLDWLAELDRPNKSASAKGIMAVRGLRANSTLIFRDPAATNSSRRFYRAVVP